MLQRTIRGGWRLWMNEPPLGYVSGQVQERSDERDNVGKRREQSRWWVEVEGGDVDEHYG